VKKTIKQLKDEKGLALSNMTQLIEVAEQEDRNLTTDEQSAFDESEKVASDMDARIKRLERSMELTKTPVTPVTFSTQNVAKSDKDLKRFSFTAAATAAYNGQMDGIVKEMHQEARSENKSRLFRGVGIPSIALESRADLPAASAEVKPTDVGSFIDQLQANSVLVQAGANFYSGISADRKFPIIADIDSGYLAEDGGSGQDADGAITNITLSPKKLISVVSMSAEMMTQNASAEAALQRNMARSISATWEAALLGNANVSNAPASIYNTADAVSPVVAGDVGTTELIDMESMILTRNYNPAAGRFAYLFNPAVLAKLKAEAGLDYTNGAFIDWANKTINGYKYYVSSNVGNGLTQASLFGDMSDVHLATFGGLDIISDRFTDAHKGLSRLVVVSLNDGKAAHVTGGTTSLVSAEVA
jgi:HK97 family phage major capsid protein